MLVCKRHLVVVSFLVVRMVYLLIGRELFCWMMPLNWKPEMNRREAKCIS